MGEIKNINYSSKGVVDMSALFGGLTISGGQICILARFGSAWLYACLDAGIAAGTALYGSGPNIQHSTQNHNGWD